MATKIFDWLFLSHFYVDLTDCRAEGIKYIVKIKNTKFETICEGLGGQNVDGHQDCKETL